MALRFRAATISRVLLSLVSSFGVGPPIGPLGLFILLFLDAARDDHDDDAAGDDAAG